MDLVVGGSVDPISSVKGTKITQNRSFVKRQVIVTKSFRRGNLIGNPFSLSLPGDYIRSQSRRSLSILSINLEVQSGYFQYKVGIQ